MVYKYPREETQVSLPEFMRTVSNKATRTHTEGHKVSYYKGRNLIGYNVELPSQPGGGVRSRCIRLV